MRDGGRGGRGGGAKRERGEREKDGSLGKKSGRAAGIKEIRLECAYLISKAGGHVINNKNDFITYMKTISNYIRSVTLRHRQNLRDFNKKN